MPASEIWRPRPWIAAGLNPALDRIDSGAIVRPPQLVVVVTLSKQMARIGGPSRIRAGYFHRGEIADIELAVLDEPGHARSEERPTGKPGFARLATDLVERPWPPEYSARGLVGQYVGPDPDNPSDCLPFPRRERDVGRAKASCEVLVPSKRDSGIAIAVSRRMAEQQQAGKCSDYYRPKHSPLIDSGAGWHFGSLRLPGKRSV